MRRILVAIDGTRASQEAARTALELAESLCMQVTFVHVLPERVSEERGDAPEFAAFEQACEEYAEDLVRQACFATGGRSWRADTQVVHGEPAPVLCELAKAEEVALVIVGARARGPLTRTLFGSVSGELMRYCTKPVMVVPERSMPTATHPGGTSAQATQ